MTPIPDPQISPVPIVINWPLIAYLIITFFLLLRLTLSLIASLRLCRAGILVDDPSWLAALDNAQNRLKLSAKVSLRRSHRIAIPVVIGWPRATILLPTTLADSVADAVLLHELAHVRRSDFAWNLLLRIVRAFYWPHPLVWLLSRSISVDRERVCDALCIHELGGPPAYRAALLSVASGLIRRPSTSIGIAMARTPRLARRLSWIDRHPGDPRCVLGLRGRIFLALATLLVVGLIGTGEVTRAQARAVPQAPAEEKPAPGRTLHLRVVDDATGKPVPKAEVCVYQSDPGNYRFTDDLGRLEIRHSEGNAPPNLRVDVWGDGFAEQTRSWNEYRGPIPDEETIRLKPGTTLGGIVKDEQGNPISGASVRIDGYKFRKQDPREILYLHAVTGPDGRWRTGGAPEPTGDLNSIEVLHPEFRHLFLTQKQGPVPPLASFRAGTAEVVMKRGQAISGRVLDEQGRPVAGAEVRWNWISNAPKEWTFKAMTDADGRFRLTDVEPGKGLNLTAAAAGHAPAVLSVEPDQAVEPIELRLGQARRLRGRVVDPEGKPIAGVWISTLSGSQILPEITVYSDADGRFQWDDAPQGSFLLSLSRRNYIEVHNQPVPPDHPEVTFTLHRGLRVFGGLFDSDGKPVLAGSIEYGVVDPKTGRVEAWKSPTSPSYGGVGRGQYSVVFEPLADAYRVRILVDGAEPFLSRPIRAEEDRVELDVHLAKHSGPIRSAVVLRPDGKPLAGARVCVGTRPQFSLNDDKFSAMTAYPERSTGPDGTFPIPNAGGPFVVLVLGDDAFALASQESLAASPKVQAQPYGRIEGEYRVGDSPLANRPIELFGNLVRDPSMMGILFQYGQTRTTDARGRFTFDRVIPFPNLRVARQDREQSAERVWTIGEAVDVRPGETTRVTVGGKGRPVVGKLAVPPGSRAKPFGRSSSIRLESNRPDVPFPPALFRGKTTLNSPNTSGLLTSWRASPEAQALYRGFVRITGGVRPDGSFRVDDVPPGDYRLVASYEQNDDYSDSKGPFAKIGLAFSIPPIPGGRSDDVLDLGTLVFRPKVTLRPGDPAPMLDVTTVDGKRINLADLKGKYVLIDFGALYDSRASLQIPRMNEVYEAFGKDDRLVILSLLCASDSPSTRQFIADKGQPWPQAIIGPLSNPVADAFGVEPNHSVLATFLIGPDGRILSDRQFYNSTNEGVAKALGK